MSVKLGIGLSNWESSNGSTELIWNIIDNAESQGWDSIWFSDRIIGPRFSLEPMIMMAATAARTTTLKFGTSVLAQSIRNPVITAKEIATLDVISQGRVLPVFGLGGEDPAEYEACGVEKKHRAALIEESIPLIRRLWLESQVTHRGQFFNLTNVDICPKPIQKPPPLWIGGRSRAALERVGRIGTGWLASNITPEEAQEGINIITDTANSYNRTIDHDHYGVILNVVLTEKESASAELANNLYITNPRVDLDIKSYIAAGTAQEIYTRIQQYVQSGISKFILRPACSLDQAVDQLSQLAQYILPYFVNPSRG